MSRLPPRATVSAFIEILGHKVQINAASNPLMETVMRLYPANNGEELRAVDNQITGEVPILSLYHLHSPSSAPDRPPRFALESGTLLGSSGQSRFIAERPKMQGRAWLCEQMLACPYLLRHQVINSLIYFLLSYQRLTPLHCCAFDINGHTLLCLGASGAGKSTLAMQAYRQGGDILAEDIAFVDLHQGKPTLRGDCREIHLLSDARRHFPWLNPAKIATSHNGKSKYLVPVSAERKIASSENFTIVFIEARHKKQQSNLRINNDKKRYEMLIKPAEPGFSLACQTRAKHLEVLKHQPSYVLEPGCRPDRAFETLASLCR